MAMIPAIDSSSNIRNNQIRHIKGVMVTTNPFGILKNEKVNGRATREELENLRQSAVARAAKFPAPILEGRVNPMQL